MTLIQDMLQPSLKLEQIERSETGFVIKATKKGFFAALASALGMGNSSSMEASEQGILLRRSSMSGEARTYVPHTQVTSTVYLLGRPIAIWILGFLIFLSGLGVSIEDIDNIAALPMMLVGLGCTIGYRYAPKTVSVGVVSSAGTVENLKLEASDEQANELLLAIASLDARVGLIRSG
jgi:hypothetical protein